MTLIPSRSPGCRAHAGGIHHTFIAAALDVHTRDMTWKLNWLPQDPGGQRTHREEGSCRLLMRAALPVQPMPSPAAPCTTRTGPPTSEGKLFPQVAQYLTG